MNLRSPMRMLCFPLAALVAALPLTASAQDVPGDDMPARPAPPVTAQPPVRPVQIVPQPVQQEPQPVEPQRGQEPFPTDAPPLPSGTVPSAAYINPPRYELRYEERRMTGLMAAGIGVFGGTYFLTAVFGGYVSEHPGFFVPVIGPVIYKSDDKAQQAALVLDTIVQAGGLAMAIAGALVKNKVAVRVPVTVLPTAVPGGGAGLAAVGQW